VELNKIRNRWGRVFVSLSTVLIIAFVFVPMIQAFIMSLQTGAGVNMRFSGISNYKRMLTDTTFRKALFNTLMYLVVQVPVMLVIGLFIAVLLNDKNLRFRGLFRIAIFMPCITSLVSYSIIMKNIFANDGLLNHILLSLHLLNAKINWTTDPFWARLLIIISITWRWTGYNMVFYISGLQNIEPSIYEAASIDGASGLKTFTRITAPLLKPIILFTSITSTIGTLQLFDEVRNITNGGPANGTVTISQYIYNLCFEYTPNFGYAAAVSFVVVVMIIILSMLQFKIGGDKNEAV
jgi:lactose/L-arabinose transport system permease protein